MPFRDLKERRMKNVWTLILACALAFSGCAKKAEDFTLTAGTPAYALAKNLAVTLPALDPDRTTILVETKGFRVTAAEVIQAARDNLGTRADQLKTYDAAQLKATIDRAAKTQAERRLLLAAAAEAKTVLPPEDLDRAMQSEYAQAGGEEAFGKALEGAEVSIDHVKKSVSETLLINKFLSGIAEKAAVMAEDDLREAYRLESTAGKTASVRHILKMTQNKTAAEKAAAKAEIEDLLAQAKAGADFAELAKQHSDDTGSKDEGGLINCLRGQMVQPFEEAAFSVPVGQLSGIVETEFGYHILQILDRQNETRPFEEARAELESRLKQGRQGRGVQDYVENLKKQAQFKLIGL